MQMFCISERGGECFNSKINLYFIHHYSKQLLGCCLVAYNNNFFFFLTIYTKNIIIISIHHMWGYLFWHQDIESQNKTYKKLHESLIFNYINSLHTYRTCYVHYYSSTNIHFSTTPSTKKKKKITVFDNLVEQNQTTLLSLSNQPANKLISELLMAIFWLLEKKKSRSIIVQ